MAYISASGDLRSKQPLHRQILAFLWSIIEGIYLFFYLLVNPTAKLPKYKEKTHSIGGGGSGGNRPGKRPPATIASLPCTAPGG